MKPSLLPLFATLLSAASLHAQDPAAPPPPGIPAPQHPPQPPQANQPLTGPGERGPHQLELPPADAPRPQPHQLELPPADAPRPQQLRLNGQQLRLTHPTQPAHAISPRAIASIEQMARAKEAEGHPDEAMELRQLIGSLHSPQGQRQAFRPQQPQTIPTIPDGPGNPSRPNADFHQQLQSLQRQLMALRNELNALRHQPSQPPFQRIAKARLEAPHHPLPDNDGSLKEHIKSAVRDLLEKHFANTGKPKKLKELRKDSPDVKEQRKSKKKSEPKDGPKDEPKDEPKHDAPPAPASDHHEADHADHKEAPKDAEPKHDAAADHDEDDHEDADDHDEDEDEDEDADDHDEDEDEDHKDEPTDGNKEG